MSASGCMETCQDGGKDEKTNLKSMPPHKLSGGLTYPEALNGAAKGFLHLIKILLKGFNSSLYFLTPEVVCVLLSHLNEAKVPSLDNSSPPFKDNNGTLAFRSQDTERAQTIIWGFKDVYFDEKCFDLVGGRQAFAPLLLSSWLGVYRWMEYFFEAVLERDFGDEDFKISFIQGSINLFAFFSIYQVHDAMAQTRGSMKLLTKLWLRHHKLPRANPFATTIVMDIIREGKKHDLDEMVEAVDGDATMLIQEILEPYRQYQLSPSAALEDRILAILPVFALFCDRPKHALCREFLINNGVREVVKSYLQCASNPFSTQGHKFIVKAPAVCFTIFSELWRCSPGHTWVIQAFRAGLLLLFVRCWDFLPLSSETETAMVNEGFLDCAMRCLSIMSVLQAANDAIREVYTRLNMETRIKLAPLESAEAWRKFENSVKGQWQIAKGLVETRLEKYEPICDFCLGYTENVKKCQGCEQAFYCSRECQIQAWKDGAHRNACHDKVQRKDDLLEPDRSIQRKFLLQIAMEEVKRNVDQLLSCPFASFRSFAPGEKADTIGIIVGLAFPDDIVMKAAIPEEDWIESDEVVYDDVPGAPLHEVRLSGNATAFLKVATIRGGQTRVETYRIRDFWASLTGDNDEKDLPTITVTRAKLLLDQE